MTLLRDAAVVVVVVEAAWAHTTLRLDQGPLRR